MDMASPTNKSCNSNPASAREQLNDLPQPIKGHHENLSDRAGALCRRVTMEHQSAIRLKWVGILLITCGSALIAAAALYDMRLLGAIGAVLTILAIGVIVLSMDRQAEERRYYDEWK